MTGADAQKLIRKGVYGGIVDVCFIFCLIMIALSVGTGWLVPRDSTDGPSGRSGLVILTDCKTGLQYLGTGNGGLTPRLLVDGNQMREACK